MQALALKTDHNALMPAIQDWQTMREMASVLVKSGFLPSAIRTAEQALAIMLKGRELGIPAMASFSLIHIIQGKPCIAAELMLALIYKNCHGAKVEFDVYDDQRCTLIATRPGHRAATFSFSMDDAKKAGLLGKDNWQKYPRAMLRSRVIAEMARSVFPDAIMGCSYTPEEMGARVDENGEVLDIPGAATIAHEKIQELVKGGTETKAAEAIAPKAKPEPFRTARKTPAPQSQKPVEKAPYNGSPEHVAILHKLLLARGVPDDLWEDIDKGLRGQNLDALPGVIKLVTDAYEAHQKQAAAENQTQDLSSGVFES